MLALYRNSAKQPVDDPSMTLDCLELRDSNLKPWEKFCETFQEVNSSDSGGFRDKPD